jgi:GTP cyclohydrolase FolE2
MASEIEIELTDMAATPCQWVLSYGDLRHVGYVQKSTGFIQLIEPVTHQQREEIKHKVEEKLSKQSLPISQPPETREIEEE